MRQAHHQPGHRVGRKDAPVLDGADVGHDPAGQLAGAVAGDLPGPGVVGSGPGVGAGGDHAVLMTLAVVGKRHQGAIVVVERVVVGCSDPDEFRMVHALRRRHFRQQPGARSPEGLHVPGNPRQQVFGFGDLPPRELEPQGDQHGLLGLLHGGRGFLRRGARGRGGLRHVGHHPQKPGRLVLLVRHVDGKAGGAGDGRLPQPLTRLHPGDVFDESDILRERRGAGIVSHERGQVGFRDLDQAVAVARRRSLTLYRILFASRCHKHESCGKRRYQPNLHGHPLCCSVGLTFQGPGKEEPRAARIPVRAASSEQYSPDAPSPSAKCRSGTGRRKEPPAADRDSHA